MARPKRDKRLKPVYKLDDAGEILESFPSVSEAAKSAGTSIAHITAACQGERPTAAGFSWCYQNKYKVTKKNWQSKALKSRAGIWKMDLNSGERFQGYASIKEAAQALSPDETKEQYDKTYFTIYRALAGRSKAAFGFKWQYKKQGE